MLSTNLFLHFHYFLIYYSKRRPICQPIYVKIPAARPGSALYIFLRFALLSCDQRHVDVHDRLDAVVPEIVGLRVDGRIVQSETAVIVAALRRLQEMTHVLAAAPGLRHLVEGIAAGLDGFPQLIVTGVVVAGHRELVAVLEAHLQPFRSSQLLQG